MELGDASNLIALEILQRRRIERGQREKETQDPWILEIPD